MRPMKVTMSAVGASAWKPVDHHKHPFSIGFGVVIDTGPANYTVQHTFDDIHDPNVTPVAFDHPDIAAQTANADGNYAHPVRAVRLNVTALTAGSVTATFIQAGI